MTLNQLKMYKKVLPLGVSVAIPNDIIDYNSVPEYNEKETINMEYFRKLLDYCKENNIQVLATCLPHPASELTISICKYTQKICDQYNINYLNFLNMEPIVNYNTDCADEHSHLNTSGARKVTDYIGKYIIENYGIKDNRQNKEFAFWNDDYNEYIDYKISTLNAHSSNRNNYLMLLYGEDDIKYEIEIKSTLDIEKDFILKNLLENIDNNYTINDKAFEAVKDDNELYNKKIKITTWDKRTDKKINTVWF